MSKKVFILCIIVASYISISFNSTLCLAETESADDLRAISRQLGYRPGELIVRFAPKAGGKDRTRAERNLVLAKMGGGTVKRSSRLVPGLTLVKLPPGATVANSLAKFRNRKDVLYAHPNRYFKAVLSVPDDTRFDEQWALDNTQVKAEERLVPTLMRSGHGILPPAAVMLSWPWLASALNAYGPNRGGGVY